MRTTVASASATTTGCTAFEYGVVCAVVKSAGGFFADVKCQFVIFAVSQMFFSG